MLQLGYLLGNLPSCWCYYNSLQRCCFQFFPNPTWRCCLEQGPSELELEAEVEKGTHMGLVQGRDVWGVVAEEERLVVDQEHAEEHAEEQEHAQKGAKNVR